MKVMTFAAGLAAGYVLGSRAGREKYEQIVASARKASDHPTVAQAQEKVKGLLSAGTEAATAKLASSAEDEELTPLEPVPRPGRRKTATTVEGTGTVPLT